MRVYLVGYAKGMLYPEQPTVFVFFGLDTPNLNAFDKFWKSKFHLEPETQDFLVLTDLKVTKMWFGSNIEHISDTFLGDFYCREGISCIVSIPNVRERLLVLTSHKNLERKAETICTTLLSDALNVTLVSWVVLYKKEYEQNKFYRNKVHSLFNRFPRVIKRIAVYDVFSTLMMKSCSY